MSHTATQSFDDKKKPRKTWRFCAALLHSDRQDKEKDAMSRPKGGAKNGI